MGRDRSPTSSCRAGHRRSSERSRAARGQPQFIHAKAWSVISACQRTRRAKPDSDRTTDTSGRRRAPSGRMVDGNRACPGHTKRGSIRARHGARRRSSAGLCRAWGHPRARGAAKFIVHDPPEVGTIRACAGCVSRCRGSVEFDVGSSAHARAAHLQSEPGRRRLRTIRGWADAPCHSWTPHFVRLEGYPRRSRCSKPAGTSRVHPRVSGTSADDHARLRARNRSIRFERSCE
jgi:hypothetical protein